MDATKERVRRRKARHFRVRKRSSGTPGRPRLAVYRSLKHIYAQVINDMPEGGSVTLVSASTRDKELREQVKSGGNVDAAKVVGAMLAKRAVAAGIKQVAFDRGGFRYHGRIKALADAARENGLEF
jgi:large subunit ribosomal protein L18